MGGGTLHQHVQEQAGLADHRDLSGDAPLEGHYGLARSAAAPRRLLAQALGVDEIQVSSLHQQGGSPWPPGLRAEAHAPDGH